MRSHNGPRFHRGGGGRGCGRSGGGRNNFTFAQTGRGGRGNGNTVSCSNENISDEICPGTNGETHPHIKCFGCSLHGHYKGECPHEVRSGIVSLHLGYMFTQGKNLFNILKTWILLDSCSTVSIARNSDMVVNIRKCAPDERLAVFTNGSAQTYNKMAEIFMFPITVHFKE